MLFRSFLLSIVLRGRRLLSGGFGESDFLDSEDVVLIPGVVVLVPKDVAGLTAGSGIVACELSSLISASARDVLHAIQLLSLSSL